MSDQSSITYCFTAELQGGIGNAIPPLFLGHLTLNLGSYRHKVFNNVGAW